MGGGGEGLDRGIKCAVFVGPKGKSVERSVYNLRLNKTACYPQSTSH